VIRLGKKKSKLIGEPLAKGHAEGTETPCYEFAGGMKLESGIVAIAL